MMTSIHVPIYDVDITIGSDDELKLPPKVAADSEGCLALVFTYEGKINLWYDKKSYYPHVLAHECVHLVNEIFFSRGVKHDPTNDEHFSYLLGYLFEAIYKETKDDLRPYDNGTDKVCEEPDKKGEHTEP